MPELISILRKLKKMSAAEVSFRLKQKLRTEKEKLYLHFSPDGLKGAQSISRRFGSISHFSSQIPIQNVKFFGLDENGDTLRTTYQKYFSNRYETMKKQADQILEHKFHLLGRDFVLPNPLQWTSNPLTGKIYPRQHFSTIPIRNSEKYGDIKYLWELNRHQFFIELGKAYFLTGDEIYAKELKDFIESWIRENPYKLTVNWTSALESAVRIFSWSWAFYFTQHSPIWRDDLKARFLRNLIREGCYIEENLSYYFSPYNHLIGELAALTFLGTILPVSKGSDIWRDKYWKEMEKEVDRQFHPDGFTVEQASYYHHFTLGFYLMIALLRRQNNLPVSQQVWEKIEKALEVSMYLTRPDGRIPMIGDIDNARSIYFYTPEDMWNLRPFLALGATLFERGDMKFVADEPAEEILWLMGSEEVEKFLEMKEEDPSKLSKAFRESGYFIMRDGWNREANYCCFDCGEIAYGVHRDETPSAAHGHADILSFELSIGGKPILIDPGFYTYFGSLDWHRYFRSTRAHNAIEVNQKGQAVHQARISWSRVSTPALNHWSSTPHFDFVCGEIDRFAGSENTVRHRRHILFRKSIYFLIMDEVAAPTTEKNFHIESFLHFVPGELKFDNGKIYLDELMIGHLAIPQGSSVQTSTGRSEVEEGWIASGYGWKEPAPLMKIAVKDILPVYMGMLFPLNPDSEEKVEFSYKGHDGLINYDFLVGDRREIIFLNPLRNIYRLPIMENIDTDALCSILCLENNQPIEFHAIRSRVLKIEGEQAFEIEEADVSVRFGDQSGSEIKIWE